MTISELNKVFDEENKEILNTLTLLVFEFENSNKNDLFILARILDEKSLIELIQYFGGHSIKIPTIEDYRSSSILASMFYMINILGMDFSSAKDFLKDKNIDLPEHESIIGKKLSKMKQFLTIKMAQVVEELNIKNGGLNNGAR